MKDRREQDRRANAPLDRRDGKSRQRLLLTMLEREIPVEAQQEFDALIRAIRMQNPTGVGEGDA